MAAMSDAPVAIYPPVATDDKLDILDRLTGWLLAEEAPLVDGRALAADLRAAIAEIAEYRAWRQGKIGIEELYTCRRKLQTATAELTRLRARIAELESEEVTDAMVEAAGKAWHRSCSSYDDAMRTALAAALRARGR